ncbi:MAG: helicase-associated domain-containing protein [Anaerolineae bacterium]|nr:helicase-associated domain-containing protein [Anaerolineae bacterium]
MHTLTQALQEHELIVLRVIGEWWDLDLTGSGKAACVKELAAALSQLNFPEEVGYLPPEEAAGIQALVQANGRMPVAAFARDFGDVRLMGPGRLEREEPWFDPANAAEALWYRGFLYRGFDETAEGVIEFYYLPDELMAQFPNSAKKGVTAAAGSAQAVATPTTTVEAPPTLLPLALSLTPPPDVTDAVDDMTTLITLAQQDGLQAGQLDETAPFLLNPHPERRSLLLNLATEMGLLALQENRLRPLPTAVTWLKTSRESQLRALAEAWSSSSWNELLRTPGLRCEGDQWHNDPILARTALLDALPRNPEWYHLDDLVSIIKNNDPDFQRPDGNYDTWYVRDLASNQYLNGFDSWERVEGRLLRYLVQAPLVWLGLAVTAVPENHPAFALTDRAVEWLNGIPAENHEVPVPLIVQPDAIILAPANANRYHRFQVGRISEVLPAQPGKPYQYRLTPTSLARAQKQGISPERIVQFLEDVAGGLPASIKRGIGRWGEKGMEGRLETAVILRVRDAAILETLRANPKTRDYLGESLGDLAVAVPAAHWESLRAAVAQLGLLLDVTVPSLA